MATETIKYQAGSVTGHGVLVWNDKIATKRPLLLVMPNWLGPTETIVKRAAKMAGDKYVAFVACMYGDGKTAEGPPESQELMMSVRKDRVEGRKRVNAALADADRGSRPSAASAIHRRRRRSASASAAAMCWSLRAAAPTSTRWCACTAISPPRCRRRRATSKPRCSSFTDRRTRWRRRPTATRWKPNSTAPKPTGNCSISAAGCIPSRRKRPTCRALPSITPAPRTRPIACWTISSRMRSRRGL